MSFPHQNSTYQEPKKTTFAEYFEFLRRNNLVKKNETDPNQKVLDAVSTVAERQFTKSPPLFEKATEPFNICYNWTDEGIARATSEFSKDVIDTTSKLKITLSFFAIQTKLPKKPLSKK